MNERERYLATLLFQSPDRIPFEPGTPRESTLRRWHTEGMPSPTDWYVALCDAIGLPRPSPGPKTQPGVNFRMHPTFEERILDHREGHYLVQDWMGNIIEISDAYDPTYIRSAKDFVTRKWHAFPVTQPSDFDAMKQRYHPDDPVRYPPDFDVRVRRLRHRTWVATVSVPGPFWQMREWCGFEPLCMLFLDNPGFVQEMVEFWTEFVCRTLRRAFDSGIVDHLQISEDMAFKGKSMISPAMVREFLLPCWSRWSREARQAGVVLVDMDSDGYVGELLPLWIEAGINVCDPVEVAAGNDLPAMRQIFGRRMAYRGGVDKRCIARAGESLTQELVRLEPVIRSGGYIPGCDHGVPPDVSWSDFVRYGRLLAEMTGWR